MGTQSRPIAAPLKGAIDAADALYTISIFVTVAEPESGPKHLTSANRISTSKSGAKFAANAAAEFVS
jgi:hypothetical protein